MRSLLISVLLFAFGTGLVAQESQPIPFQDRLVPRFGYVLSFLNTTDTTADPLGSFNYSFNTVSVGSYIMLAHHNDWASVGADAGLGFGINIGQNNRLNWQVQAPVMVMGRIGAAATAYNEQRLGLGLGIGGTATYMNFVSTNLEQQALWFHPTAAAEVNIGTNSGMITLRGTMSLGRANGTGNVATDFGGAVYPIDTGGPIKGRLITLGLQYGF